MTHTKHTGVTNRKINRRTLIGGSAAAATGALLAGKRSSTFAAPMINKLQGPITLEFWGGEPEENGPGDLVADFNANHPDIQVKYTRYVNDDTGNTQLDTALQGGTQIDVYKSYGIPRTSQRITSEAAIDLTPYVEADAEIKGWIETESVFKYNDLYYSLPTVRDPYVLIANKNMLDDAGLTLPESWTMDEFREMAKQLSSDTVFGTYAPHDQSIPILGPNRWYKEGGTESNFDDPAFRTSLEFHKGMIDEGSSYPWSDVLARDLRVYQQGIFLTEQTALWPSSSFVLRYVNDLEEFPHEFITTFTSMPTPVGVEDPWTPGTVDNNILINPNTADVDAAWEFVRFRVVEGAHHYLKSAKQPAFPGTPVEDIVAGILGPDRDKLYDVAAYTRVISAPDMRIPTDTIATASAQIQQIFQAQSDLFLIGEIDIDTCLTEIKTQADAAIAQAEQ